MPAIPSPAFRQPYDATTKVVSTLVCVGFVIAALVSKSPLLAGVEVALLALAYAYSPRGCTVREGAIVVDRRIGEVRIPLAGIREARTATPEDLRGCLRLWASGGLFGYYGLFRTSKLGRCWWYVTNRRNIVVVVTAAQTSLFSPDDTHGFLEAIRTAVPAAIPVPEVSLENPLAPSPPSSSAGSTVGKWLAGVFALIVLAFVAASLLYSPGPPSYTLTSSALTIHDRFYPVTLQAADVDVEHIRVVEIGRGSEWRPITRTNGFANSHYRSGWFRVANGQKVRLYRAAAMQVVLLPPLGDHAPVLLETKDPEKFAEQVRQAWSKGTM
jgi:hypothetical protein